MEPPFSSQPTDAERDGPSLWFRILLPGGPLGPGKIDLLRLVGETGSVSAAARRLRMSHARSVKLVAEINALGAEPLIRTRIGGEAGGGAALTDRARRLLLDHERLEAAVREAAAPHLRSMVSGLEADEHP